MSSKSTRSAFQRVDEDVESDYGSDFSPEDIILLDRLLIQVNSELTPALAIVDRDDEPGHGHFANVPHGQQINHNDGNEKEVFTQSNHDSSDRNIARLVSATLAGPPSFGPELPFDEGYQTSEFYDEALDSWEVWQDALSKSDNEVEPVTTAPNEINQVLGTTLKNALKIAPHRDPTQGISPLAKFRSPPKKPLSVTDLVSPAWCELQYYFTLSRYGKIRPTVAMKRGSEVHAKLEEEIFTRVQVPIQSREDAWALQLWNLIISLRTLRESGMTREMQVWGILHGEVIAGVIDELRIGTDLDEKALRKDAELDLTITNQALLLDEKRSLLDSPDRKDDRRIVFLTDMKTRASKSIPRGASLRGTVYQLMLYQTLLADLVSNRTNWGKIIERYGLDPLKPFTETFLEQMYELEDPEAIKSDMNHKTFDTESQDPVQSSSHSIETPSSSFLRHMARLGDSVTEPSISAPSETNVPIGSQYSSISSLSPTQSFSRPISQPISQPSNANSGPVDNHQHLRPVQQVAPYTPTPLAPSSLFHRHNTLSSLLTLLAREITLTFPYGSSSLSPYLHACYRDKNTGEITGQRVFRYDADILSAYVSSEMAWWNGTRDTKGVEVEEAFKCNMCEFAPGCRWRADMKANAENRHKDSTSSAVRVQKEPGINQSKPDRVNAQDERISDGNSKPKIPGEWISETSSETVMQQQGGIEVGGGRKGQERSRSVI